MQIVEENSHKLVLEKKTGINIFLIIWSLFFSGIPLFMAITFFSSLGINKISCEKINLNQVNCTLNRTGFGGFIPVEFKSLDNVINAKFQQIEGKDDEGSITIDSKVILENKQGNQILIEDLIFINGVKGDAKQMQQTASDINNFLTNNQSSLILNLDNRWRWINLFIFGFVSIFIIIGNIVLLDSILSIGYQQIVLNKRKNQYEFTKVNLLGTKKQYHNFNNINSIVIEKYVDGEQYTSYTLFMMISDNKKYQIDKHHQLNIMENNANKISNFLNIPVKKEIKE